MRFLADDEAIIIDEAVAASEQRTGFRNVALANYMKSFGVLDNPVELHARRLFPPLRDRDDVPATRDGRTLSGAIRRQSVDRPLRRVGGARAPHQRADADLRPL